MSFLMRILALAVLAVGGHLSGATAIAAAGTYRMTIRQCDGPLAAIYDTGTKANVTIGDVGDVTIAQQAPLAARMTDNNWLVNQGDTVTETTGRYAGVTVTKGISIKIVNGDAVGGVIKYVLSEDGRTKSGTIVFSLARTG